MSATSGRSRKRELPPPAVAERTTAELLPNLSNPRTISDVALGQLGRSMREFGDISGIVWNRRTGRLVGGHQRRKNLPDDARIEIFQPFDPPSAAGTIALGTIELDGERFLYREVDWPEEKERAANVRANVSAGEWNTELLIQALVSVRDEGGELQLTGFNEHALAKLLEPATRNEKWTQSQLGDATFQIVVTVKDENEQAELCADLEARGFSCKLLAL